MDEIIEKMFDGLLDGIGDLFGSADGIDAVGSGADMPTSGGNSNPSDWFGDDAIGDVDSSTDGDISFGGSGRKMCPSSHGCQGATDCDYCYGDY